MLFDANDRSGRLGAYKRGVESVALRTEQSGNGVVVAGAAKVVLGGEQIIVMRTNPTQQIQ